MNIHNNKYYNYFTSITNQITTNKIISSNSLTQAVQNIYQKVTKSVTGQLAINSIKENVVEYIGYYSMATVTGHLASRVMGTVMSQTGFFVGNALTLVTAAAAGKYALETVKGNQAAKMAKVAVIVMLTTAPVFYLLPDTLSSAGEYIGTEIGLQAGSLIGGIIGAHKAIQLVGSKEILWESNQISKTYTFKTIQSTIGVELLNTLNLPIKGINKIVLDLIFSSLIYNAQDIQETIQSTKNGHLFDDFLPRQLKTEHLLYNHTIRLLITNPIASSLSENLTEEAKVEKIVYNQLFEELSAIIPKNILQEMIKNEVKNLFKFTLDNGFLTKKDQIIFENLQDYTNPLINQMLLIQETHIGLIEKNSNHLLNLFIHSVNQYMTIFNDKKINQIQKDFLESFAIFSKSKNIADKMANEIDLESKKDKLKTTILSILRKDLIQSSFLGLSSEIIDLQFKNSPFDIIRSQIPVEYFKKFLNSKIINFLDTSEKGITSDINQYSDVLSQKLNEQFQKLEENLFGFSFTSAENQLFFKQVFDIHLPLISKLVILNCLKANFDVSENEMRKFYLNMNHLIWEHYSHLLPSSISNSLKTITDRQITSSIFKS